MNLEFKAFEPVINWLSRLIGTWGCHTESKITAEGVRRCLGQLSLLDLPSQEKENQLLQASSFPAQCISTRLPQFILYYYFFTFI